MKYNATHTTYRNTNGHEVPSVTTILKILNKPFLAKWANIQGFKRNNIDDLLKESSYLGTMVHHIIESYLMGRKYMWLSPNQDMKYQIMLRLSGFISWKKNHDVIPTFMERKCFSEYYGGTIDFYGMVDGKHTILDFKTSKKAYSSMFLQLAAYTQMVEEMGLQVDQVAIINIHPNAYKEKFIQRDELQPYIDCFNQLLELFHTWYNLNISDGWGDILA
ncbi:PD-(D/E)XK nuclease superfamily protein [compost metagenome]